MHISIHIEVVGRRFCLNHLALVLKMLKGGIDLTAPFIIVVGGLLRSATKLNHRSFPIRNSLIKFSEFSHNCGVELSFNKLITRKLYISELRVLLPSLIYHSSFKWIPWSKYFDLFQTSTYHRELMKHGERRRRIEWILIVDSINSAPIESDAHIAHIQWWFGKEGIICEIICNFHPGLHAPSMKEEISPVTIADKQSRNLRKPSLWFLIINYNPRRS